MDVNTNSVPRESFEVKHSDAVLITYGYHPDFVETIWFDRDSPDDFTEEVIVRRNQDNKFFKATINYFCFAHKSVDTQVKFAEVFKVENKEKEIIEYI